MKPEPQPIPADPGLTRVERRVTFPNPGQARPTKPQVHNNQLYLDGVNYSQPATCPLDSPAWFAWLETTATFRYYSTRTRPVARGYSRPLYPISLRKEKRRRGFLWYAYLRKGGQLLKRYAGRSAALTIARLDDLALDLNYG